MGGDKLHPHLQQQLNKQPVLMVQLQMLLVIVPHPLRQHKKQHSLQQQLNKQPVLMVQLQMLLVIVPPVQQTEQSAPPKTLTQQTCPPLPIDANGKCPGIDMRGGGLGYRHRHHNQHR